MPGHPAHVGVDGHPVIVQDHDHRLVRGPGVIQSDVYKRQSPIRGPEGNIEYLGYLKKCDEPDGSFDLPALVAESHSQLKD